ncbi:MAG: glycosyltransferase family 4 protein [Bacteroidetes bacterium]|nr:glycosyltransferase family 4 protein [Bacteroidota bacterium]
MNIETHQIYIESLFNKILYVLLPLHYIILKKHVKENILPKKKIDIIHSNILFPCAIIGYQLSNYFKCKHIITEHWSKLNHFFKNNIYRSYGKKTIDNADAITCVSDILQTTLKKHTSNKNIFVLPNVIDQSDFYFDSSISKDPTFTFVAAANWTVPKNPFYFLDALKRLKDENKIPNFKLYLIGNGHQLDVALRLNQSHLFLHGSDYETFSTIIAEALMCGLPSVVSPVGIASEVINDSNGFIADNTPDDWFTKILKCYTTSYDPIYISEQLKNKYDLKTVGNLFDKVYEKVLP